MNIVFIFQEKFPNVVPILSGKLIETKVEKSYCWGPPPGVSAHLFLLQIQQLFSQILLPISLYGQKRGQFLFEIENTI